MSTEAIEERDRSPLLLVGYQHPTLADHVRALEAHTVVVHAHDEAAVNLYVKNGHHADVILWRIGASADDDIDALRRIRTRYPNAARITHGRMSEGQLMRAIEDGGIHEHIADPCYPAQLALVIGRALESHELARRHRHLARRFKLAEDQVSQMRTVAARTQSSYDTLGRLVYRSHAMVRVAALAKKAAKTNLPVLIQGETGTGKELLARAIHGASPRNTHPLLVQNCGAVNDQMLLSELFGHKRGAYTGAIADRLGLFLAADGGTILLDEISEVSSAFQVSLLRVLQNGEVKRVGDDHVQSCDVRVIAACNRPLKALVDAERFRSDLYFRLNAFEIVLPPLRDRLDDVPVLVEYLAEMYGGRFGGMSDELVERLQSYDWPGNVRELENEVRRMIALAERGECLTSGHLSPGLQSAPVRKRTRPTTVFIPRGVTLKEKVESLESHVVKESLERHGWNRSKAANKLGLSRPGLANKIVRYNLGTAGDTEVG